MMRNDPPRLHGQPTDLGKLLDDAHRDVLDRARVEGVVTRLGPAAEASLAASGAGVSSSIKLAAIAVVGATAALLALGRSSSEEPPARPAAASPAPVASKAAPPPAPAAPSEIPPAAGLDDDPPVESPRAAQRRTATDTPPADELGLLRAARAALDADPTRALALLTTHAKRHAASVLAQEREVMAVDALVRLGRGTEARRRADQILRADPRTAHRARLEDILARCGARCRSP